MNTIKQNIIANFAGGLWSGLMGLVFVPLYIHFMGIEAYGLIGIFTSLLALLSLLDMGLSSTLNREIARMVVQKKNAQDIRDLVRTLEIPYWLISLLVAVIITLASPVIAYHWVKVGNLSPDSVRTAIIIMGLAYAFQWPASLYSGGLMGLQRQVLLNSIYVVMATVRGFGAVLVLWLVSPTVEAFFLWQIVVSIIQTGLIAIFLWRSLPDAGTKPRFRRQLLLNIWHFAAGMTGISVLGTILTQMDKIVLSRILSLEMFGYYSLAYLVAASLFRLITPVFSATYPQLTSFVELGALKDLTMLYHKSAQLVSVLVLPAAFVLALFSKQILLLWTRNPTLVEHTYLLVSIMAMGTAFNSLLNIPYALQLAHGWTRLALLAHFVSILLLVPLLVLFTKWYGAVGAASIWVILNVSYVIFVIQIMHQRLLRAEKWRWYYQDVGMPFVVALVVAGFLRIAVPVPDQKLFQVGYVALVAVLTLGSTAMATSVTRDWIRAHCCALSL